MHIGLTHVPLPDTRPTEHGKGATELREALGVQMTVRTDYALAAIKTAFVAVLQNVRQLLLPLAPMIMKNILALVCTAGLVLAAAEARAGYSIDLTASGPGSSDSNPISTTIGQLGQSSSFTVDFNGSSDAGKYFNYSYSVAMDVNGVLTPTAFTIGTISVGSPLNLDSPITSANLNHNYTIVVPWTAVSGSGLYDINLSVWTTSTPGGAFDSTPGHAAFASATSYVNIASVPEASQIAASAFLFLGGVAVYAGRRSIRKKAGQAVS